jgi:serine-type D-Ala-D-Ala carboxypeptidase (penicillin-binding protein 5/6)
MRHSIYRMAAALLAGCLLCGVPAGVLAEQGNESGSVGTADAAAQGQQAEQIAEYTGTKPYVSAQGYCVIDAATGEVIVGNQEQEVFAPASITKIMTLLVAAEHCADLDEMVAMSESALDALELMSSTISPMPKSGEMFSIRSLMYGMIMKSGNECANLLAERVAGSLDAFADLMNQRASQAGALQTHFSNPSGLDADNHKTTPYDMAMIMKAALENPTADTPIQVQNDP